MLCKQEFMANHSCGVAQEAASGTIAEGDPFGGEARRGEGHFRLYSDVEEQTLIDALQRLDLGPKPRRD